MLKFVRVSNGIHTSAYSFFFLKNREKFLKEHLEHLDSLHSWTYNPHIKNYIIANTINFKNFLLNFYYIESEAFSEHN